MNRLLQIFRSPDVETELVLQLPPGDKIHEHSVISGVVTFKAAKNRSGATISAACINLTGVVYAEVCVCVCVCV